MSKEGPQGSYKFALKAAERNLRVFVLGLKELGICLTFFAFCEMSALSEWTSTSHSYAPWFTDVYNQ
jgi:hypothetical protein